MEGAIKHLWEFKDKTAGDKVVAEYLVRRDGNGKAENVPDAENRTSKKKKKRGKKTDEGFSNKPLYSAS